MSAQFGMCNFDGRPVEEGYLDKISTRLAAYGPDGKGQSNKDGIGILYHAFHTTSDSRLEVQPHMLKSGAILTWDGRLDNRTVLIRDLAEMVSNESCDVEIVAAAYQKWGTGSFARLIGDWALAICEPDKRVILAKDFAGIRHLYYSFQNDTVTWCTVLDPLVLFAGRTLALNEEYIAGWVASFPAPHLTPYAGIDSVPPSSFVVIRPGHRKTTKFWDFDYHKRTRYSSDPEYEGHFRSVFSDAVTRRLRCDTPVLAELSGGMDSSSIVCMADLAFGRGLVDSPRLDTISYYDDSEPHWNEKPYFAKVEERRGRRGCHIDVSSRDLMSSTFHENDHAFAPGAIHHNDEVSRQFNLCLMSQGNRVVLSGIGGDEATGGVPTPIPELQDLLAKGELRFLAHQLKVWALNKRRPWFYLFFEAIRDFLPPAVVGVAKHRQPAPWLAADFVNRNRIALRGYRGRLKFFGPTPTFQANLNALGVLRRQLESTPLPSGTPYEVRYPYLDRDLLEFLYAIPREQLVRPGRRRSLMRRALIGIVPDEIIERKRKAYVSRSPLAAITGQWSTLQADGELASRAIGVVDEGALSEVLKKARDGFEVPVVALLRTHILELWLRSLLDRQLLGDFTMGRESRDRLQPYEVWRKTA